MVFGNSRQNSVQAELTRLYPALWRYALSLSGRADRADDLAQAASQRALERADQYEIGSNFKAWIFTICRSVWFNDLRRNAIRRTESLDAVNAADLGHGYFDAEANIFATQVFNEVMGLPEAMRDTVVLVYVEGFTYREAADILNVPIGTVMSRLAAARARLAPLNAPDMDKG